MATEAIQAREARVNWKEWRWVLGWSAVILLVTSLPYLYGAYISTPASQFSGFVIGVEDGNSYLAKMQEGRSGSWLFHLAYTPEPHQPELFFSFYILLGKIAGITNLSNVLVFHLSKILVVPFGVLAFYYFAAHFTHQVIVRRTALLITGVTGGLGWLWLALGGKGQLGQMPVDLWVPDASFFLTALTYPHLPLAQGLLLLFSIAGLNFARSGEKPSGLIAAGCGLAVSLIHPYTLPVIGLILGLYLLWQNHSRQRQLFLGVARLLLVALPTFPYLFYLLLVFKRNMAFRVMKEQILTYSPEPIHYLLGFSPLLLLAALGLWATWGRGDDKLGFLRVWVISVPLLLYVPSALQRRFLDGYQSPLAVLGAMGLVWLIEKVRVQRWHTVLVAPTLIGMSITNLILLAGAFITIAGRPDMVFLPNPEVLAAHWLADQTSQSVVLASYETGNYLPTVADIRVFLGHGPETIASDDKGRLVNHFYQVDTSDTWRRELLTQYAITYVYVGLHEKELGRFEPKQAPYLRQAYDNGTVQIYQVLLEDGL